MVQACYIAHPGPRTTKARKPLSFRAFKMVAGAGFEPATFGL